ncbi:MAG TPA: Holliday junction resolvase RuvX [Woeseiaceae bacterium]
MPATPDTRIPQTILAFDFGLRRIGVAVGQTVTGSANPLGTVPNSGDGPDWRRIGQLVSEWGAARLVVGMPLHVDGSPSEMTAKVQAFVAGLEQFKLPIETIDERYSSAEAVQMLVAQRKLGARSRIRRETIDAAAATLIAERWLRQER